MGWRKAQKTSIDGRNDGKSYNTKRDRLFDHPDADRNCLPGRSDGALLNPLHARGLDDSIDEDPRGMDLVWVQFADWYELLHFSNADLATSRHHWVEVSGGLAINQVAKAIATPRLDKRKIRADASLHHKCLAIEDFVGLSLGDLGREPGSGVKSWNPGATCSKSLRQRSLRGEFNFKFARHELTFKFGVFSYVARDHPANLSSLQEQSKPPVVNPGVVARDGQTLDATIAQGDDQILWDSAESKSTDCDQHSISDETLKRIGARVMDLVYSHWRAQCRQVG